MTRTEKTLPFVTYLLLVVMPLLLATMCGPETSPSPAPTPTAPERGESHHQDAPSPAPASPSATQLLPTLTASPATSAPPTATRLPPLSGSGGGVIAFQSDRDRQDEIYVMNADGSDQRLLISNQGALDSQPAWSPDGSRIAYASRDRGQDFEICVVRIAADLQPVEGATATRLTDNNVDDLRPAWSPNGTRIAFYAGRGGDTEIYVIDVDGTNERQLTDNETNDQDPAWSPGGTQMAFISRRDGDFEIYLMEPDGSDQKALTDNDTNEWAPAWSPDGTQIAFISDRDGARDLYVMSADGGLAWRLTDEAHPWNDEPAWSPDGRWIAFRSNVGGYVDLYLIAAGGTSGPRQITENAEYDQDRAPAWQPVGVPGAP